MRTLVFTAITDSRFEDVAQAMEQRQEAYAKALNSIGCLFKTSSVETFSCSAEAPYYFADNRCFAVPEDEQQKKEIEEQLTSKYGNAWELIVPQPTKQLRCKYWVQKTSKVTWNNVMAVINSVKAVPFSYEQCDKI